MMSRKLLLQVTSHRIKSHYNLFCDIPSVKQIPLLRNVIPVELMLCGGGEKLHEFIDKRHKLLGPVFREQLGPTTSIFLSNPIDMRTIFTNEGKYPKHVLPESWLVYNKVNNCKRGLYFMDGEEWFECRKILNRILLKGFHVNKFQLDDFFTRHFETWKQNLNNGEIMDLEKRLYNLSNIYMLLYLMGDSFTSHEKMFLTLADRLALVVREIFHWSVKLSTVTANLARMCRFNSWNQFVSSVDESIKICKYMTYAYLWRTIVQIATDLLELVIRLGGGNGIVREMIDSGIPKELIRSIVIDFIMAAGDTTATATQWTLYLLGLNRDIQEQIFTELKNQDDYKKVLLLKNTIRESMRLYPIAPFITRYLPNDIRTGEYTIKAGELISMSMLTCSRNETYFPEANKFIPNRWIRSPENGQYKLVTDPFASLPYGQGSRACIGQKMAQTQLITTIGKIISMYELRTINEVGIKLNLITVPSESIRLQIKKRS